MLFPQGGPSGSSGSKSASGMRSSKVKAAADIAKVGADSDDDDDEDDDEEEEDMWEDMRLFFLKYICYFITYSYYF